MNKEYEDKFLQELKQEFDGIDLITPEEEERERERERERAASAWVRVAQKRGHGLSIAEEAALNI